MFYKIDSYTKKSIGVSMKRKQKIKMKKKVKYIVIFVFLISAIVYIYPSIKNLEEKEQGVLDNKKIPIEIKKPYDEVSSSNKNVGSIKDRLKLMEKKYPKVEEILNHYEEYPESLLDMLSRNEEMIDFVSDYLKKEKKAYSNTVGNIEKKTIPLLLQWDKRWGYAPYGNLNIAVSGCGPTALSMVIVGLTGNKEITPYKVAKLSEEEGYYVEGVGTSWNLMTEGVKKFGIQSRQIPLSKNSIYNALQSGHPIICSMKPGDFTTGGHFIVLSKIENGKIKVNDPSSIKRSDLLWEYDRIESQIKNLWEFYK